MVVDWFVWILGFFAYGLIVVGLYIWFCFTYFGFVLSFYFVVVVCDFRVVCVEFGLVFDSWFGCVWLVFGFAFTSAGFGLLGLVCLYFVIARLACFVVEFD